MKFKNLILLLILASLWGPSFLFIKVAVAEIPPVSLAAIRIGLAAVLLNLFLLAKGGKLSTSIKFWKHVLIAGFFAHALPFVLISWGEIFVDTGLASILNGLTPLFTIVLANFMMADDKMTPAKLTGTLFGFIGLVILVSPQFTWTMQSTTVGIVAIIIAAASYGVAMVYARKFLSKTPPLHAPSAQLLVTSVYLIPFSFMVEGVYDFSAVSLNAIGSLLILATFGTAVAFVIYYKIIETAHASYLSLVTYLMPVYGVILGVVFLDEIVFAETIIGALLIIFGVMVANGTIKLFKPAQTPA